MSSDLLWLLTRNNNSFQLKRNNRVFSRDPSNLLNASSFKYSSTSKPVSVINNKKGFQLVLKKKGAAANKVKSSNVVINFKQLKTKSVSNLLKKYRSDLVGDALHRAERIISTQGAGKPVRAKKVRGSKK